MKSKQGRFWALLLMTRVISTALVLCFSRTDQLLSFVEQGKKRVVDGDALKVTGGVGTILVRRQQEEEVADRGQTGESKGLPGGR